MTDAFTYHFHRDPAKAAENLAKHGVSFRLSTTIFRDALALTADRREIADYENTPR